MPISPGVRLGSYEALSPLGAGGMGKVCRARDGKLGREVAIRVLPTEAFSRFTFVCVLFVCNLASFGAIFGCNTAPAPSSETASRAGARSVMTLPPNEPLVVRSSPTLALSPDGAHLVYAAGRGGSRQLYLRAMDSLEGEPIPGTEGASTPFFSPTGIGWDFMLEAS